MTQYYLTFINPLKLLEWEPAYHAPNLPENPAPKDLLKFLCPLDMPSDMSAFRKRYNDVSEHDRGLFLSLEESALKENLFGPLRQAKTNYVTGNYVGSIALCGIVAEKIAILIHAISTPDKTKREEFEGLGQAKRVKHLKRAKLIDEQFERDFDAIREVRIDYLHYWQIAEERTAERAVQAYAAAIRLVLGMMDAEISEGQVRLNSKLTEYLSIGIEK